jgi:hypothetical protein
MAGWRPLKRRDFIRKLRSLGFEGPYSGTRHQFMVSGQHRQTIPTNSEYSVAQLRVLIRQVESILARQVSAEEWNSL